MTAPPSVSTSVAHRPTGATPRAGAPRSVDAASPPARCSALLQKASIEALSADETAYLKQACR